MNYSEECNESDVLKIPRNVLNMRPPVWAAEVVLTQEAEKLSTIINQKHMRTLFPFLLKTYRKFVPEKIK